MQIGQWTFTTASNELSQRDSTIKLEAQCSMVLEYLAKNAGEVVTNDMLLDAVWGRQSVSVQSIPVVISKLRNILGDDTKTPKYIETIHKRGYRLIAKVTLPLAKNVDEKETQSGLKFTNIFKQIFVVGSVLTAIIIFNQMYIPSNSLPSTLYVADVENLTTYKAMDEIAAGASEVLTSQLVGQKSFSIVRLRRRQGEIQWMAPGLAEGDERPYPLLTSSIVPKEEGIGVYMQLEDGADHRIVWTHQFFQTGEAFASLYRDAAKKLLAHYSLENTPQKELYASPVAGVEEIFLRANYLWGLRGRENNLPAHELALQALEMDPDYVPAYGLLAEIYTRYDAEYLNLGEMDTVNLARDYIEKAIELNPEHPSILLAGASQTITLDWRPDLALKMAEKAVELAPQNGMAHRILATTNYLLGRLDKNNSELKKALEIELGSPFVKLERILALFAEEKYEEVIELYLSVAPEFLGSYRVYIALSFAELGRHKEAIKALSDHLDITEKDITDPTHPLALIEAGRTKEAYDALISQVPQFYNNDRALVMVAILKLYNGETETVPGLLAKIPFSRSTNALNAIHMWPVFYRFKDDPVMQELLTRIGVAPYATCPHKACI